MRRLGMREKTHDFAHGSAAISREHPRAGCSLLARAVWCASVGEWWAGRSGPRCGCRTFLEGTRLVAVVLREGPPELAGGLEQWVRAALGSAPLPAEAEKALPVLAAGVGLVSGAPRCPRPVSLRPAVR